MRSGSQNREKASARRAVPVGLLHMHDNSLKNLGVFVRVEDLELHLKLIESGAVNYLNRAVHPYSLPNALG